MGLFGIFGGAESDRKAEEVRSGARAPDRSERARCWAARDAYFACLDANGIVDSLKEEGRANKACGHQNADFERDCARQWVTYFKKWRVADHQKKQTLARLKEQGANEMTVETQFKK